MTENRDVLSRAAIPPDHVLRYGDHADAIADVWFAVDPAASVVMLWHGGFWRVAFDRTHLRPMANAVRDEGFTVVMPEYRRTGGDGDGGWPGTFDDVARASDVLPGMVAAESGTDSPVMHAGHSAGGHLAVWAARRHLLPASAPWRRATPAPIAAVVALAPVLDLAEAFRLDLDDGAVQALLGG
ncbi:MAG: alpha/beta hydrolase, partial [Thermomicrobiales bacterium]